eukprot:jgi/Mesen1/8564/ME000493S07920
MIEKKRAVMKVLEKGGDVEMKGGGREDGIEGRGAAAAPSLVGSNPLMTDENKPKGEGDPVSRMARLLCSPTPPVKQKRGTAVLAELGLGASSRTRGREPAGSQEQGRPFAFETPSPDDAVLAAQRISHGQGASKQPSFSTSSGPTQQAARTTGQPGATAGKGGRADVGSRAGVLPAGSREPHHKSEQSPAGPSGSRSGAGLARGFAAASEEDAAADTGGRMSKLSIDNGANAQPLPPGGKPGGREGTGKGLEDKGKGSLGQGLEGKGKGKSSAAPLPLESYVPEAWMLAGAASPADEKDILHLVVGKASFAYAWVLDEGADERARGVTMSVAVAHFETAKRRIVLLDAPGHRDFVPSMISGASQADAAILVIDATPGAFEDGMDGQQGGGAGGAGSGQTREHAQLARSLGVEQLLVAVNKLDSVDYSQDVFESIRGQLAPFLRVCGFRDAGIQWLPISGLDGQNLSRKPTAPKLLSWYHGPTLLEAIDAFKPPARQVGRPLRLAVAEIMRSRSLGQAALSGKLEGGAIRPGSKVLVSPMGELATVKALEMRGQAVPVARAGDSVDVGLLDVDASAIVPGGVLCHPEYPIPVATRFEAKVLTLVLAVPLLRGSQGFEGDWGNGW